MTAERSRLEALVEKWPDDHGDPPDTEYQRGYMDARRDCADELAAELAGADTTGVLANELSVARFEMERLRARLWAVEGKLEIVDRSTSPDDIVDYCRAALEIVRAALLNASPAPVKASTPPVKAPAADPGCPYCGGLGERFWHSPDCRSDDCALAGGVDDCAGVVVPCPCVLRPPAPDARMQEPLPRPNHPEIPDGSPPAHERSIAASVLRVKAREFRQWANHSQRVDPASDIREAEKLERVATWLETPPVPTMHQKQIATDALDPAVLAELERLHEAATPGPWWPADSSFPAGKQLIARVPNAEGGGDQIMSRDDTASFQREANARLIAAMRNNLPAILSALRGGHD